MKFNKYTLQQLEIAVKDSFSKRNVLSKLGIAKSGGNYETLEKAIDFYNLDTSHFTGKGWLKDRTHTYRLRPLDEVLVENKLENTHKLKNRLIKEGIKYVKCENCLLTEWLNLPIPLELHHVDGNRKNNKLENIQLLCPNCHARTDNYRGKNKK